MRGLLSLTFIVGALAAPIGCGTTTIGSGPSCSPAFHVAANGLPAEACTLTLTKANRSLVFNVRREPADPFADVCASETYACVGPTGTFECTRGCGHLEIGHGDASAVHAALGLSRERDPTVTTTLTCGATTVWPEVELYACMY